MSLEQKRCRRCKALKLLDKFHSDVTKKHGKSSICKECSKQGNRERALKANYGITEKQYQALLSNQNYCCAICESKTPGRGNKNFMVDHNHETKEVRSLLCFSCNTALGHFKDSPKLLKRAIQYLEENGHYGVWSDA
jgi:hypothetical protein